MVIRLKIRNTLLIIVGYYVILFVISIFLEIQSANQKANTIYETMREAADITLEQTQSVDDFLTNTNVEEYKVLHPKTTGNGYEKEDLYKYVFGLDSQADGTKDQIFQRLYVDGEAGNDFMDMTSQSTAMKRPIRYIKPFSETIKWGYMPTAVFMGFDVIGGRTGMKITTPNGEEDMVTSTHVYREYGHTTYKKQTNGEDYFNTPISLGMTFINKEMTAKLFSNNMDLIMRGKYDGNHNLNSKEGGYGVYRGITYGTNVDSTAVDNLNPINDGLITYLRGKKAEVGLGYEGIEPTVNYKVFDMYDSRNDKIMNQIFGAYKGEFNTKAEYLKHLDREKIDPVTGQPYTSKPIVVAKVTFYADVVIPYFSVVFRGIVDYVRPEGNTYGITQPSLDGQDNKTRRLSYTRLFAVAP